MNIEILEAVSEKLEVRIGYNKKLNFLSTVRGFDFWLSFDPLFWSTNFFYEIYD